MPSLPAVPGEEQRRRCRQWIKVMHLYISCAGLYSDTNIVTKFCVGTSCKVFLNDALTKLNLRIYNGSVLCNWQMKRIKFMHQFLRCTGSEKLEEFKNLFRMPTFAKIATSTVANRENEGTHKVYLLFTLRKNSIFARCAGKHFVTQQSHFVALFS